MPALAGRVAVVTGADQPLGRGLALAVGAAGASVGLVGATRALAGVTAELDARGGRATAVGADLTDTAEVAAAFATVADELGEPVRVVVHAAIDPVAFEPAPFEAVDDARFDAVWEGTMRAALAVLQASYAQMRGVGGHVLVVTPTVALSGAPGLAAYAAALEGQRLLAKSAARQWGPEGVRVNCLAPAPEHVPIGVRGVDVSLAPAALGGPGDPERDLGPVAVFLAGDDAHFVTGATIGVDGGVWMAP